MRALLNVAIALPLVWAITLTAPALAQTFSSGSSGADGAFTPTTNTTLTLPANGVFNFTTISIPSGVIVRFTRNAANTPVTLLATASVTIAGTLEVSATNGGNVVDGTFLGSNAGAGGPGGFAGGSGANGGARAIGGTGPVRGRGRAIRLVATTINGANGTLDVRGGSGNSGIGIGSGGGSVGRLRVEAYTNSAVLNVNAIAPSVALPSAVALANGPTLTITAIGGVVTPAAPTASFSMPDITLPAAIANPVTLTLTGTNIPPGATVIVVVNGQTGGSIAVSTTLSGTMASTRATAAVTIPTNRPCVVSASATFTPVTAGIAPVTIAVAQRDVV